MIYFSIIKFPTYLIADTIKFFLFFALKLNELSLSRFNFFPFINIVDGLESADKSSNGFMSKTNRLATFPSSIVPNDSKYECVLLGSQSPAPARGPLPPTPAGLQW